MLIEMPGYMIATAAKAWYDVRRLIEIEFAWQHARHHGNRIADLAATKTGF